MIFDCVQNNRTQNRLRLIVITTAFVSLALSFISIRRCTFVLSGDVSDPDARMYGWGLFTTPVYDKDGNIQGCVAYPSSMELGPSLKTAQAFGILLVIFTMSIAIGMTLVQCFLERGAKVIYHMVRVFLPSAFCCQLLTFSAFASSFCDMMEDEEDEDVMVPSTCMPGGTGVVAIFNLVALIVMTILMSMVAPPDHPIFQLYGTGNSVVISKDGSTRANSSGRPQKKSKRKHKERKMEKVSLMEPRRPGRDTVKTTIVNGPQIKKTIKEITHPDGSQTITTTVEEIQPYCDDTTEMDDYGDDDSTLIEVI